jgi:hypothetical protein
VAGMVVGEVAIAYQVTIKSLRIAGFMTVI